MFLILVGFILFCFVLFFNLKFTILFQIVTVSYLFGIFTGGINSFSNVTVFILFIQNIRIGGLTSSYSNKATLKFSSWLSYHGTCISQYIHVLVQI